MYLISTVNTILIMTSRPNHIPTYTGDFMGPHTVNSNWINLCAF